MRWTLFAIVMLLCLLAVYHNAHVYPPHLFIGAPLMALAYGLFVFLSRRQVRPPDQPRTGLAGWIFWGAALLLLPWAALRQYFGPYSINAVYFHLQEGLGGAASLASVASISLSILLLLILGHGTFTLLRLLPFRRIGLMLAAGLLLGLNPLHQSVAREFLHPVWADQGAPNFAAMLVNPEITAIPERPKKPDPDLS